MASDSDRNLWDAIGLANNTDLASTQEKEQSLCNNGTQERALHSTVPSATQGTSLGRKSAADPGLVSISDMVSCGKCPDVPATNGSSSVEQRNHREAEEHIAVVAVNVNNSEQGEAPVVRQERSIFEHISNNFRPSVIISQTNGRENGPSENGIHKTTSETAVLSDLDCLPLEGTKRNVETSGNTEGEKNIFERVRINSYIDSLAQQTSFTKEGNGGFPFSEKLRQLTTINKETGSEMSTSVRPLRTGYDSVTSGRTFQQLAPTSGPHSRPAGNVVAARIVNGQFQSLGTQVVAPQEASHVDANVIFPSVTPIKYANPVSTKPNQDVLSGFNAVDGNTVVKNNGVIEANSVIIQPNAVAELKRIASEKPKAEHAQSNLVPTHLVGPFISTGPPPPNSYVAAVRTARGQAIHNGLQLSAYPSQLQAVRSPLKGHTSPAGLQLVMPVLTPPSPVVNRIILPQPTPAERNAVSTDKQLSLVCGERLVASPDLQERVFRPVSPARVGFYTNASPRVSQERVLFQARSLLHNSPLGARRSIFTRKTDIDRRGSVEEELADQSYECALRESANSPDIERYLRCESPVTVLNSPNFKRNTCSGESYFMESCDSHVDSIAVCNGECEDIDIPSPPAEICADFSAPKSPESTFSGESGKSAEDSKRKLNSAMVRRLEPRLPSPVRENSGGDLYRDPSQLTREERALQRAMMQFSEMEMKEKAKQTNKKASFKRRLRKRGKEKATTIVNGNKKQSATKVWLKKFKRKRLWFSQRRSITVKQSVQEDKAAVKSSVDQQAKPVKRKRFHSQHDNEQPTKTRRKSTETDKHAVAAKPKDVFETTEASPDCKNTDNKTANVRRSSSDTRRSKKTKPEALESASYKRPNTPELDMGKKVVKRVSVEIDPLQLKRQDSIPHKSSGISKADKSHRVKTYMLVTAYQGFRDFKPIVLESRTRGKSKQTIEESPQKTPKAPEFPLLVVESVNSKPVKNSVIAENEEVQQFVENCLKARGKWQVGDTTEEPLEGNDDDTLKEARKLNVNRNTGETILHKAARLGYHETVHHHIHQGIDPNAKDNAGWTPLHEACSRGKVGVVKVLAKYGADVNACSNDGIRPIHDAAEGGHVGVLRVLLSYGADPLLATYSGNSAFSCTKDSNTRDFLEGFLEDVDLKTFSASETESEGCWEFSGSCSVLDESSDHTSGIFEGVPLGDSVLQGEFEMCDRPHLPTYNLPVMISDDSTSGRRNYVLLCDLLEHLRISRTALFKKARKLEIREMPWSQFLCEIADKPLCMAPKYSPPDSSVQEGVAELVAINYNLRRLLNIRVESVNMT